MSTATAFKYYRPFPFCLSSTAEPATYDYVDVTLADAMAIWWNLESLSFVTTGNFESSSIDFTNTFGPTESLGITPTSSARGGAYYDGTTPANAPRNRVCKTVSNPITFSFTESGGSAATNIILTINLRSSGNPSLPVRVYYILAINSFVANTGGFSLVAVRNPANIEVDGGEPASSGTFSIGPITFDWVGGAAQVNGTLSEYIWTSDEVTFDVTSGLYTY